MSKATDARVRDELLQTLYTHVLRCALASATSGLQAEDAATAAGVFANLRASDMVLLPTRPDGHGSGLRALRGLSPVPSPTGQARDRSARVYPLPADEAQATAFCLAMGIAAADALTGDTSTPSALSHVVVVVLPRRIQLKVSHAKLRGLPGTWSEAAAWAARAALPLLFVSLERRPAGRNTAAGAAAEPSRPAPLYPSIPVDSDDALAVYRVAFECLARARAGGGPSHLAAARYPALPGALAGDGLCRLEAMLRKRGCYSKAWQRALERDLTRELSKQS
jgi:hypothetical protein